MCLCRVCMSPTFVVLSFLFCFFLQCVFFFFFKQKTAYEMRISDWSSDVCSSDLSSTFCLSASSLNTLSRSSRRLAGLVSTGSVRFGIPPPDALGPVSVSITVDGTSVLKSMFNPPERQAERPDRSSHLQCPPEYRRGAVSGRTQGPGMQAVPDRQSRRNSRPEDCRRRDRYGAGRRDRKSAVSGKSGAGRVE